MYSIKASNELLIKVNNLGDIPTQMSYKISKGI